MRVLLATAFAMTTALDTRWDAATALLASTVPARRTRDHRAKHAVVIANAVVRSTRISDLDVERMPL